MPIKESTDTAYDAFTRIRRQRIATRDYFERRRTEVAAGCSAALVLSMAEHCRDVIAAMDTAAAIPGLGDFAKTQYGDTAYNISTEWQTLRATLVSLRNDVVTMFPQDANGWLLYQKISATGVLTTRTFTAPQLSALLPLIDAVIAAIA